MNQCRLQRGLLITLKFPPNKGNHGLPKSLKLEICLSSRDLLGPNRPIIKDVIQVYVCSWLLVLNACDFRMNTVIGINAWIIIRGVCNFRK